MAAHVAVIARKSTRDEHQVSIPQQGRLGRTWAEQTHPGRDVVTYVDDGISGARMDRPGWLAFTAAIRANQVHAVWAHEQSRLTRAGVATWDEVAIMLWAAGIADITTHQQGRISVAEGSRLQGRILAVVDQEELERARLRAREAQHTLAVEGRPFGGRIYGYRRIIVDGRKQLIPDDAEAAVIQRIAADVIAGHPLAHIARTLNDAGIPTARGTTWGVSHVRSVVTKPSVAGLRVHQGQIVRDATWAPILDRDTWDRARSVLSDGRTVTDRRGRVLTVPAAHRRGRRYLLTSGLARCGLCRSALIGQVHSSRGSSRAIYSCHPSTGPDACSRISIRADPLEDHVVERLFAGLGERPIVADTDDRGERRALMLELGDVRARGTQLARDYATGLLPQAAYEAGRDELSGRTIGLEGRLGALQAVSVDLDNVDGRWDGLTLTGKRAVLDRLIVAVTVNPATRGRRYFDDRRVTIDWR